MFDMRDLIAEEWLDDTSRLKINFTGEENSYKKIEEKEFMDCLDALDFEEVETDIKETFGGYRFTYWYESSLRVLAHRNGWEIINGLAYRENKK